MKHLKTYDTLLNEKWFSRKKEDRKPSKFKPILSLDDYKKMTPEEMEANKKELEEERKRLDAEEERQKKKKRADFKEADDKLNELLKSYIGKKYKFQYSQFVWKSKSENYNEIDTTDFLFTGINIEPRYDWNSNKMVAAYFTLNFTDRYNNNVEVVFEEDSPTENKIDLEYAKPWELKRDIALRGTYDYKLSGFDYDNPDNYPHRNISVELVPNDYKTVTLLQEIKNILQGVNDTIKPK